MSKLRMAVLLSGSGRTLENFCARIAEGTLHAEIVVVGSTREDAYGLVRARNHGIDSFCLPSKDFGKKWRAYSLQMTDRLKPYEPELIVLAGFMCFYVVPPEYSAKVMNIHPALIPSFCGRGWYGHIVHEGVLAAGVKVSGCTVHFADNAYDHGPIILQRPVPVLDDDTPDTLAERVFQEERIAYPEAVELFAERRLRIEGRRVRILPAGSSCGSR